MQEDIPEHIKCDKSPIPDPEGLNVSFVQNFSEKVYKFRRQLEGKPYLRMYPPNLGTLLVRPFVSCFTPHLIV